MKTLPFYTVVFSTIALTALPTMAQLNIQTGIAPTMRGELTTPIFHANTANLLDQSVAGVPSISANISNVNRIPTIIINANQSGSTRLDVSLIDDFIDDVAPNARHYPPNFPNRTAEFVTGENIKYLSDWLEPYAKANDATFDVILRAAKINGMARNLNIGTDYTQRANKYMAKAVKLAPNDAETNFLYGMMISESGGFVEGQKYLQKAASLGYLEAEQSLAQAELLADNHAGALSRLRALKSQNPANAQIAEQVRIVEDGGYYIWKIKNDNINVKPLQLARDRKSVV